LNPSIVKYSFFIQFFRCGLLFLQKSTKEATERVFSMGKKLLLLASIVLSALIGVGFCATAAQAETAKKVLIVVDYQVDFVDGALGKNPYAIAIENNVCQKIAAYQKAGDIVIYTMDTHPSEGYAQTREGKIVAPHCVPGTNGWNLYGRVGALLTNKAIMVKKSTYGSPDLPKVIESLKIQGISISSIELIGVSTSVCVFHNTMILYDFFPDIPLALDAKCCAAKTPEVHNHALEQLKKFGVIINNF
jgi:nicotinamidase/pyrazinamidase